MRIILFIWIFILNQYLFSINYPITPTIPEVGNSENNSDINKKTIPNNNIKNNSTKISEIWVSVTLGNGNIITGEINIPEEISFSHIKNGFSYNKSISPDEIKTIEIIEFSYHKVNQKNNFTQYEFQPSKIRILLRNRKEYEINYLFKFLIQFKIKTDDGNTQLFSFFSDTFHEKNGWSEVNSKDYNYHIKLPHSTSVKKITFFADNPIIK